MQIVAYGVNNVMVWTIKGLKLATFKPDFGFHGPALWTTAVLAGVFQNYPVMLVRAFIHMIALVPCSAGHNIPCGLSLMLTHHVLIAIGFEVIKEYPLYYPCFHWVLFPV